MVEIFLSVGMDVGVKIVMNVGDVLIEMVIDVLGFIGVLIDVVIVLGVGVD